MSVSYYQYKLLNTQEEQRSQEMNYWLLLIRYLRYLLFCRVGYATANVNSEHEVVPVFQYHVVKA